MNKKRLLLASLIFWVPVILFSYIAGEILERESIPFDNTILNWIRGHSSIFLDNFLLFITTIGNAEVITPLALAICAALWWRKYKRSAVFVFISFFGAAAANFILKMLFYRDRPSFWQSAVHETGYSFPSGHAMTSNALVCSIIVLAWNTRWRWYVAAVGALYVGLMGYSRLYLGVHYPTDVIAGWLAGAAWVFVVTLTVYDQGPIRNWLKKVQKSK